MTARRPVKKRATARRRAKSPRTDLLKISALARRADTPKETIHYYLRLGLLSKPVETSRNMAYYGERHVDELKLIARLRAESYLPLDKIKVVLDEDRRAASARELDLAGDLFGRGAKLAMDPIDAAGVAQRSGLPAAVVADAVAAGVLGRPGGGFGWEDLRIAEVMAEARASTGDEALVERLEILDRHVRAMVDDELRHFFATIAAGIEPERGLELLHGGRQTIGRYLSVARARRVREGIERVLAEVDAVAQRTFEPAPPLPESRRKALGEKAVRAKLAAEGPRAAFLRHLLLQADAAAVLAHGDPREDAAIMAEACVELAQYPEALAHLRAAGTRTPLLDIVWSAATLARLRDALAAPRATGEPAWAVLARLRGDVVRDLLAGLGTLARAASRIDAALEPLDAVRAQLLLARVYLGTPAFLGLRPAARAALDAAEAGLERLAGTAADPGLGVVERLRQLLIRERARL